MAATTTELLQGTLDLLILKAISLGPTHGYGVLLRIQQVSRDKLQIQQGSLYPAGRRRLTEEVAYWRRLSAAIGLVIESEPGDV